jgi:hypothetical protein
MARRSTHRRHSSASPAGAPPRPGGSDVSRDGQRMLVNMPAAEVAPTPMTLVLNWSAALRK